MTSFPVAKLQIDARACGRDARQYSGKLVFLSYPPPQRARATIGFANTSLRGVSVLLSALCARGRFFFAVRVFFAAAYRCVCMTSAGVYFVRACGNSCEYREERREVELVVGASYYLEGLAVHANARIMKCIFCGL